MKGRARNFSVGSNTSKSNFFPRRSSLEVSSNLDNEKIKEEQMIIQNNLDLLHGMFPTWELSSLEIVLDAHSYKIQESIDSLLRMEEDSSPRNKKEYSGKVYKPKNPLPDDFLRVPSNPLSLQDKETSSDDEKLSEGSIEDILDENTNETNESEGMENHHNDQCERKTTEAEEKKDNILLDSSIAKTLKRSKLNISEAKERLQNRTIPPVHDFLAKASVLYQKGIINNDELCILRELVVSKFQQVRAIIGPPSIAVEVMDYDWNMLVLKSKGIRRALSVTIVSHQVCSNSTTGIKEVGHSLYSIRVVDLETGSIWFINRRYREFYKLYKKIVQLIPRLKNCPFPGRRPGKSLDPELTRQRQIILQYFLRQISGLVSPLPIDFLRGCVLKEFQNFLSAGRRHSNLKRLDSDKDKLAKQALHCAVYHILYDPFSLEGKACNIFLERERRYGMHKKSLCNLSEFIDSIHGYIMQQRLDFLETYLQYIHKTKKDLNDLPISFSDIVREEVENRVYIPIMDELHEYLKRRNSIEENHLLQKISSLKGKPQSFFDIPVEKISVSSWKPVVHEINHLDSVQLPVEKLKVLVRSANRIHTLYQDERAIIEKTLSLEEGDENPSKDVLCGDDFLPIYIYAIVHSDLKNPLVTNIVLSSLCDSEKRLGETGYYLASFEAAIHHILSMDVIDGRVLHRGSSITSSQSDS